MVREGNGDMSESEIIGLFTEYNFKKEEISSILKELKARDFESVLEYAEQYRADKNTDKERESALKAARKYGEELRREEELKTRQKEMILEKIKANREEQAARAVAAERAHPVIEKTNQIKAYIKVKAILNGKDEIILGFEKDATTKDLFNKLLEHLSVQTIKISRFGHSPAVEVSDKKLLDEFGAKTIMLDVAY